MKYLLFLISAFSLITSSSAFSAGMQTQLDQMYTDMENYTAPGTYETARRSSYYGGRYTYKTRIFDENLISMRLPSAKGGCGGIDVFGGSFSFVNSDQIVQLLRSVASNAKGYAFQLAMDNMCPDCSKWMNELQSKVQALNDNLSNSCQLAQGIINDASKSDLIPFKIKEQTQASITASLSGAADDFSEAAKSIKDAGTAVKRWFDSDPASFDESTGSEVYKALMAHSASSWFVGGDVQLIEEIQSMTGTVVKGELVTGEEGTGQDTQIILLPGNKIQIIDLIRGAAKKQIYDCGADHKTKNCRISPSNTKSVDIQGLRSRILDAFTGDTGLITMIRNKDLGKELSENQKNVLAAMPASIGSKIYELAPLSPDAAESLVNQTIDAITLEYVYNLVKQAYQAVDVALASTQSDYKAKTISEMKKSKAILDSEYTTLSATYGSITSIEEHYSSILKNVQKPKYVVDDTQRGTKAE